MPAKPFASVVEKFQLAPGAIHPIDAWGDFFLIVEANTEIEVSRSGAPFSPYAQGDGEQLAPGQEFSRLEVRNPTLSTAFVTLYAGYGRRVQSRQSIMEQPTEATGGGVQSLAAGASVSLLGVATGNHIRRKAVMVTNFDLANPLLICDAAGNAFSACLAGTAWVQNVATACSVKNASGTAVSCVVGEVWYLAR